MASTRLAIIGMGPMGKRHLQAARLVKTVTLAGVADRRPEALAGADGARAFLDPHEMLAEVRPELVIVATNGPSHHELVLAAMAAGAEAILCEKPMACSLGEAEAMIAAARESGCRLALNFGRRYVPAYRWLAERLQSGEWGDLRSIRGSWPGIGLGCVGVHMIDLWRFLGASPLTRVWGWVDAVRGPNPRGSEYRDPGGLIVATAARGARYVHEQIEDGAGPGSLVIDTTGAQITVDEYAGTVRVLLRDPAVKPGPGRPPRYDCVPLPAEAPLDVNLVRISASLLDELAQGGKLSCTGEDGLRALEVVIGAYLSDQRGHVAVELPLTDDAARSTWLPIT